MRNKSSQAESAALSRVKLVVLSCAAGLIVMLALLVLFAVLMSQIDLPPALAGMLSSLALIAGALVSGIIAGRIRRRNGMGTGALCGLVLFILCLALGLPLGGGISALLPLKLAMLLISAAIGGIIGVNLRARG